MDVAAENATELPRLGRPRMKLNVHASQTTAVQMQNKKVFSASDSGEQSQDERTNRYESGNAIDGQLYAGTWSLESRRHD